MHDVVIRNAVDADRAAILAIYNHYVLHSTATFAEEPMTEAAGAAWFRGHGARHPVLVLERAGTVLGWASLSPHRERAAYRDTCELSIYLHSEACGAGYGKRLL